MIKIAIVGYGYWGPNLLRNFNNQTDCTVKYIVDNNRDSLAAAKRQFPSITATNLFDEVIKDT